MQPPNMKKKVLKKKMCAVALLLSILPPLTLYDINIFPGNKIIKKISDRLYHGWNLPTVYTVK